jgi:hypothetical protein
MLLGGQIRNVLIFSKYYYLYLTFPLTSVYDRMTLLEKVEGDDLGLFPNLALVTRCFYSSGTTIFS